METVGAYTDRVTPDNEWREGNPTTNEPATPLLSPYFNMLQREMLAVLSEAGIEPDKADDNQIAAAIAKLISNHSKGRNHPMATTGDRGMVRFATESEHSAAARDDRATTPAGVKLMVQQFLAPRVSLVGPSLVYPDTTNTYTITDYSDFSTYEVSASRGTATIDEDTVTLVVGAGEEAGSLDLIVTRDDLDVVHEVAVGEQSIARPSLVYPGDGDTDVDLQPTLQASSFQTYPSDADSHVSSDWEIATDSDFTDIVVSTTADQENLTSWPVGESLPIDTLLYARIRQTGNSLGQTDWSPVVSFTTTNQYIVTPSITSPSDGATEIPEQPILETTDFETDPQDTDTHRATSWWVYDADDNVVWESLEDTENLTSIALPAGELSEGETLYKVEAQHHGELLHDSGRSAQVSFTTEDQFIPQEAGTPFGGGYTARIMLDEVGDEYMLIVSPKPEGSDDDDQKSWSQATSYVNGLTIGGHNDWALPTIDEMRVLFRDFKPTTTSNNTSYGATTRVDPPLDNYTPGDPSQTTLVEFQEGGSEAFIDGYWSSTEVSSFNAERVYFLAGVENDGQKTSTTYLRAVRRVYL